MYKSILVPIDLAETDVAKPAIAQAATLSQTFGATVRLLNIMPMTPVMLAEYVPADFDTQQSRIGAGRSCCGGTRLRHRQQPRLQRGATGRHLSRDSRKKPRRSRPISL